MDEYEIPKWTLGRAILTVFLRILILLGGTIVVSAVYKGVIEAGFFSLVSHRLLRRIVFCVVELLLLGIYWYVLFLYAGLCRQFSFSAKDYYVQTVIVCVVFAASYLLAFFSLSREAFSWLFRLTLNLIGVRFVTNLPDELLPYILIYLAVTVLILLLEPLISKWLFLRLEKRLQAEEDELYL